MRMRACGSSSVVWKSLGLVLIVGCLFAVQHPWPRTSGDVAREGKPRSDPGDGPRDSISSVSLLAEAISKAGIPWANNAPSSRELFTEDATLEDPVFDCSVPKQMRLQAGCWVSGASGHYTGPKKEPPHDFTPLVGGMSQSGEDLYLLENFFFEKNDGTFLEMGGLNGLKLSNSYFYEHQMNWTGIMIEGSPIRFQELRRNRPEVVGVNAMICNGRRNLHWVGNGGPTDGAWELMTEEFKKKWYPDLTAEALQQLPTVPCVSLGDLLRKFRVKHVDLFSLDVEGAESSVLRTIDFSKFTASVILLETRAEPESPDTAVNQLLRAGYYDFGSYSRNRIFLHPKFKATLPTRTTKAE